MVVMFWDRTIAASIAERSLQLFHLAPYEQLQMAAEHPCVVEQPYRVKYNVLFKSMWHVDE